MKKKKKIIKELEQNIENVQKHLERRESDFAIGQESYRKDIDSLKEKNRLLTKELETLKKRCKEPLIRSSPRTIISDGVWCVNPGVLADETIRFTYPVATLIGGEQIEQAEICCLNPCSTCEEKIEGSGDDIECVAPSEGRFLILCRTCGKHAKNDSESSVNAINRWNAINKKESQR